MATDEALATFLADARHSPRVRALAARGTLRRYRRGTVLIHEGELGDTVFIVVAGRVTVACQDSQGREIRFGDFGAGEYVGEMALDGGPRSASVTTLEPTTCAVVTRATLRAFIAQEPEFAFELLAKVIQRLRLATRDARNLAFVDVYGRLAPLLEGLAEPQADGSRRIAQRLTHQEIASRVGCSREMVSRILKDLEVGGYLQVAERHLVLLKALPARW